MLDGMSEILRTAMGRGDDLHRLVDAALNDVGAPRPGSVDDYLLLLNELGEIWRAYDLDRWEDTNLDRIDELPVRRQADFKARIAAKRADLEDLQL